MPETQQQEQQLQLPDNFSQILVEVLDPAQSCDYLELGGRDIPIQVLTISAEKKFKRLSQKHEADYEQMISLAVGELCHWYFPELSIKWAAEHADQDDLEKLYLQHLEKSIYNDEVESVVNQMINQIEWKPADPKRSEQLKVYLPARIFAPVFSYNSTIEGLTLHDVWHTMTRGMLAITRLGNMITNDQMRILPEDMKPVDKVQQQMTNAKTSSEYLAGLASQGGLSMKDLI